MPKHSTEPTPICVAPGCGSFRYPNSLFCKFHWQRLHRAEQQQITRLLCTIGCWAFAGEQAQLEQAIAELDTYLEPIGRALHGRPPFPDDAAPPARAANG
jgi:hypothetical protein